MDEPTMRARAAASRVGRLATVHPTGRPHVVVCCFAIEGDHLFSAVDHKPKRTAALQRLENVAADGRASLLVDHYDDGDWSVLWWVRVDGEAAVVSSGPRHERGLRLLAHKYPQYRERPPNGPVIVIRAQRWVGWP